MTGKIRIEHTTPATGNPTQDMNKADEYLLVTRQGNEIMVAYSHDAPEDATPMLMEAANLLGRFNQVNVAARAMNAQNQQGNPTTPGSFAHRLGENQQAGPRPMPQAPAQTEDGQPAVTPDEPDLTDVERELDQY